jgi:DNA invertase Pin-like site-specific DNA recombinase
MRAAIYLRVSTAEQTTDNQERELGAAARMGHDVVEVYRDHAVSGSKGRDKRPGSTISIAMPLAAGSIWSWRGR